MLPGLVSNVLLFYNIVRGKNNILNHRRKSKNVLIVRDKHTARTSLEIYKDLNCIVVQVFGLSISVHD